MADDQHISADRQLVGSMVQSGTPEFIRWTFWPDGSAALDRPGRYQFRIPLYQEPAAAPAATRFTAGEIAFAGTLEDARFTGTATEGTAHGACDLRLVRPLTTGYGALFGPYRFPAGRTILLSRDERPDEALYFYVDQDQVVRLHPVGDDQFFSEQCETVTARRDTHGTAQVLSWQGYGAAPVEAARTAAWTEDAIRIPVADHVLAGTLWRPDGPGPHPTVILCHLANTHRRDYYRIYAESFVRRGIAAFIYDKRGSGDSTGAPLFSEIFPLADDATAVFRFLQRHPAVRAHALGFWGMSNGAWVIALAAERVGTAAFLIAASGSGVSPARQEQWRRANVARALGASPRAVALIERLWARLFQFAVDGQWSDDLESILMQVYADEELQRLPKHPDHGPGLQPVPPREPIAQIRAADGGTWAEGGFDPAPVYARLRCPIFCVWGAEDDVLPVEESRRQLQQALRESAHPDYQLHVVPQATHLLYVQPPTPSGILADVMHTHLHNVSLVPGVRQHMAHWAAQRLGIDRPGARGG